MGSVSLTTLVCLWVWGCKCRRKSIIGVCPLSGLQVVVHSPTCAASRRCGALWWVVLLHSRVTRSSKRTLSSTTTPRLSLGWGDEVERGPVDGRGVVRRSDWLLGAVRWSPQTVTPLSPLVPSHGPPVHCIRITFTLSDTSPYLWF